MLPNYLTNSIETAIRGFWWGSGSTKPMAWLPWSQLCKPKAQGGLGLRDLRAFNRALLAKQCWRILFNPDSLMGQIFRARYFPNSTFMEASLGIRPSATWRSILHTRPLIKQGLRVRIGNGFHIEIWSSSWIPEDGNFKPITPRPTGVFFPHRVADLIDSNTGTWNREIVESTFWPVDRSRILAIPLGAITVDDREIWHYEKNGCFSVRSCYRLALSAHLTTPGVSSGSGGIEGRWKEIWKLPIPPKIRIFLWRACLESLPVSIELFRRHVIPNPFCINCGSEPESISHVLTKCRGMRAIWSDHPFSLPPFDQGSSMWTIYGKLKKLLSLELFEVAVVLCWKIWEIRNQQLHGAETNSTTDIVKWCSSYLLEYKQAQALFAKPNPTTGPSLWSPPVFDFIKINVDAAIPEGIDSYRVSGVAHNHEGRLLWWYRTELVGRPPATDAEAVAILHGVRVALQKGWRRVVLETDCLPIFHNLTATSPSLYSYGAILDAILELRSFFHVLSLTFVRRSGNSLAHDIATSPFLPCSEGFSFPIVLS